MSQYTYALPRMRGIEFELRNNFVGVVGSSSVSEPLLVVDDVRDFQVASGANKRTKVSLTGGNRRSGLLLTVPADKPVSIDIRTTGGDVRIKDMRANYLQVRSATGALALHDFAVAYSVGLETAGNVAMTGLQVEGRVVAVLGRSGVCDVRDSKAELWELTTDRGDITLRSVHGAVEPISKHGKVTIT